jgi:Uma2 family endonuclease
METETRLFTADEFLRMPETTARLELVRGEVVERQFGSWLAGSVAATLGMHLARNVESRDLGVTFGPCGFHLWSDPDTVRAPSIAFVTRDRADEVKRGRRPHEDRYFPGAPDLAVEITSVWDAYDLMMGKVLDWLAAGTRLVWLVSPACRTVTVYRSRNDIAVLTEDDVLEGEDVVPGWRLPVRDIFA